MALRGSVVAAVLNRPGSLGPDPVRRSRGALPLAMVGHASADEAARAAAALNAGLWRRFNLVLADRDAAFFVAGLVAGQPRVTRLVEGVPLITAHDPNSPESPSTRRHLPRFRAAAAPDPHRGDWRHKEALRVSPRDGFGTVYASLLALGAKGERFWRFCPGPPGAAPVHDMPAGSTL